MTRARLRGLALAGTVVLAACSGGAETPIDLASDTASPDTTAPSVTVLESSTSTSNVPTSSIDSNEAAPESGLVLVSGEDLVGVLSGNTAIGNWVGEDYRQFFDPSGATIYQPDGAPSGSTGEWRVNVTTGQYESLWPPFPGWDEYDVFRDGDDWFWTGAGVELSPFTIVQGDQLSDNS